MSLFTLEFDSTSEQDQESEFVGHKSTDVPPSIIQNSNNENQPRNTSRSNKIPVKHPKRISHKVKKKYIRKHQISSKTTTESNIFLKEVDNSGNIPSGDDTNSQEIQPNHSESCDLSSNPFCIDSDLSDETTPKIEKTESDIYNTKVNDDPNHKIISKSQTNKPSRFEYKDTFLQYLINRQIKISIKGKSYHFSFLQDQSITYNAFAQTRSSNFIYFQKNDPFSSDSLNNAVLVQGNDGKDFTLRTKPKGGHEIFTIRFSPIKSEQSVREMVITFFEFKHVIKFKSNLKEHATDISGSSIIPSVKNAIIVDNHNSNTVIRIQKVRKNQLMIESILVCDPLWIFAIGISSFLSQVK